MSAPELDADSILRQRARELAGSSDATEAVGEVIEVLEFRLAKERYALETSHLQEVCPLRDLTALPGTPAFILGIVNVRGRIIPVLDLKKFFGLPEQGLTDLHSIILVRGNDLELGLLADIVVGVRNLPTANLQPSLPTLTGIRANYLRGVSEERLIILDLGRILADPGIIVHEEVA